MEQTCVPPRTTPRSPGVGAVHGCRAAAYRRLEVSSIQSWSSAYGRGERDYSGPAESARYGILAGYLRLVEGSPSILDFGCGTGILLERIQRIRFHDYVGIDSSPVAIELAWKRVPGVGTFVVGEDVPTTAGPFDVIVCNEVLYYLSDPGAGIGSELSSAQVGAS